MKIQIIRSANVKRENREYCIGHLYIDGEFFCDTLEDYDRGLDECMPLDKVAQKKISGKTAVPTGNYLIHMNVVSTRYSLIPYYQTFCKGKMPRLNAVRGFNGVLIHPGNTEADSEGCILVGENKAVGMLLNSRDTWKQLYLKMLAVSNMCGTISLEIKRKYKV